MEQIMIVENDVDIVLSNIVGLGLAIAAEIIQLHEGTIRVKSQNNLTTFTLQLPFLRET